MGLARHLDPGGGQDALFEDQRGRDGKDHRQVAALCLDLVAELAAARALAEVAAQGRAAQQAAAEVREQLTDLRARRLDLLKATRSTDEIAAELVLSTETVRSHVKNILRKLGVHSRQEGVTVADKMRTTSPPPVDDPEDGSRPA